MSRYLAEALQAIGKTSLENADSKLERQASPAAIGTTVGGGFRGSEAICVDDAMQAAVVHCALCHVHSHIHYACGQVQG